MGIKILLKKRVLKKITDYKKNVVSNPIPKEKGYIKKPKYRA